MSISNGNYPNSKLGETIMSKLEKIKSQIKTNIENYFIAEEKSDKEWSEKHGFSCSFKRAEYDYLVRINEDENAVSIIFDGSMFYDLINTHFVSTGKGTEDYREQSWFCDETASKIFGLSKYHWEQYASYQIDVYTN
jgi:hypothetical protein